jgi:hypothetical protein
MVLVTITPQNRHGRKDSNEPDLAAHECRCQVKYISDIYNPPNPRLVVAFAQAAAPASGAHRNSEQKASGAGLIELKLGPDLPPRRLAAAPEAALSLDLTTSGSR